MPKRQRQQEVRRDPHKAHLRPEVGRLLSEGNLPDDIWEECKCDCGPVCKAHTGENDTQLFGIPAWMVGGGSSSEDPSVLMERRQMGL